MPLTTNAMITREEDVGLARHQDPGSEDDAEGGEEQQDPQPGVDDELLHDAQPTSGGSSRSEVTTGGVRWSRAEGPARRAGVRGADLRPDPGHRTPRHRRAAEGPAHRRPGRTRARSDPTTTPTSCATSTARSASPLTPRPLWTSRFAEQTGVAAAYFWPMSNDPVEPGVGADDLLGRWLAHHDKPAEEGAAPAPRRVPIAARPSAAAAPRTRLSASAALAELAGNPWTCATGWARRRAVDLRRQAAARLATAGRRGTGTERRASRSSTGPRRSGSSRSSSRSVRKKSEPKEEPEKDKRGRLSRLRSRVAGPAEDEEAPESPAVEAPPVSLHDAPVAYVPPPVFKTPPPPAPVDARRRRARCPLRGHGRPVGRRLPPGHRTRAGGRTAGAADARTRAEPVPEPEPEPEPELPSPEPEPAPVPGPPARARAGGPEPVRARNPNPPPSRCSPARTLPPPPSASCRSSRTTARSRTCPQSPTQQQTRQPMPTPPPSAVSWPAPGRPRPRARRAASDARGAPGVEHARHRNGVARRAACWRPREPRPRPPQAPAPARPVPAVAVAKVPLLPVEQPVETVPSAPAMEMPSVYEFAPLKTSRRVPHAHAHRRARHVGLPGLRRLPVP